MPNLNSLLDYQRVKYVGDLKDVKLITNLKRKSLQKLAQFHADNDIIRKYENDLRYNDELTNADSLNLYPEYFPELVENKETYPVEMRDIIPSDLSVNWNTYGSDELTILDIKRTSCSLTGGYARNILMGTDLTGTDLDITGDPYGLGKLLSLSLKEDKDSIHVKSFFTEDNHIHVLPEYMSYFTDLNGKKILGEPYRISRYVDYEGILFHNFIAPERFDFTVNCGCISSEDGYLYAPAITIHDIENKILRSPYNLIEEDCLREIANISTSIRAVRFLHKYDMSMHKNVYRGVITLFAMQKDMETTDDRKLHLALKKLYQDSESVRHSVFKTLQQLGLYETDRYSNFDDYFQYISSKLDNPRQQTFSVESRFFSY